MSASLRARGGEPLHCDAWVYDGGNMVPRLTPDEMHVGTTHVQWDVGVGDPVVHSVGV
jgi:hypothetical protein